MVMLMLIGVTFVTVTICLLYGTKMSFNFKDCLMYVLDRGLIPDFVIRGAITLKLTHKQHELSKLKNTCPNYLDKFIHESMKNEICSDDKIEHFYELDTSFFNHILGKYKKYSATLYPTSSTMIKTRSSNTTCVADSAVDNYNNIDAPNVRLDEAFTMLDESEILMMDLYISQLNLSLKFENNNVNKSKYHVLDLGCGWGSFSFYFAKKYPNCEIISLTNSKKQIDYIKNQCKIENIINIKPVLGNVSNLKSNLLLMNNNINNIKFDLIICIEIFEHLSNYVSLLTDISKLLKKNGQLLIHCFVNKYLPYIFTTSKSSSNYNHSNNKRHHDWLNKYFVSQGTMLSYDLLPYIVNKYKSKIRLNLKKSIKINGKHYSYTIESWLTNMDNNKDKLKNIISNMYNIKNDNNNNNNQLIDAWWNRWRLFSLATSQTFKYQNGNVWYIALYLFEPTVDQ